MAYCWDCRDIRLVTVVVLDGEELPISTCLIQHRLAHQLGSSLVLQECPVLDPLTLAVTHVIQLCSLLKIVSTLRSVEEFLGIRGGNLEHSFLKMLKVNKRVSTVHTLME